MKRYFKYLLFALPLAACGEKDILLVDTSSPSLNILKGELNGNDDPEIYTFNAYFLGSGSGNHDVKIPVMLSGKIDYDNDRVYAVRANPEKSRNAREGVHYTLSGEQIFGRGVARDSISLTIHIAALSEEDDYKIWLELVPNDNFSAGVPKYQYMEIDFIRNINTAPAFWATDATLRNYTYHPRKCAKFLEVSRITNPDWTRPANSNIALYWIEVCTLWFEDNDIRDENGQRIYFNE